MWRHEFSKRESNSRTYKSGELMHKHNISVFRIISRIKLICLRSELNVAFSEFVWTLRSSVLVVFNNFLLIDATDISCNQKRLFFPASLYPL